MAKVIDQKNDRRLIMLFHDQSFADRIRFLQLNVCDFPEELTYANIDYQQPELVLEGLKELNELFREVYSSTHVFDNGDPLKSYHNVCDTIMFLYSAGYVGDLCQEGNNYFLNINKKEFKSHYKSSMNKPADNLLEFGFYFEYYQKGKEVKSLNRCSTFYLLCDSYQVNAP